ncbi:dihydroxyacetone kinase family protein [Leucobacter sp. wl10]|uniref:dihydroxyacetone kinase family protein n=1 Tax=Leucobacter sp. wl10 TaxID=2304677 RepID=UPI000E5B4B09|nr:dihydroxyacetone kinase family protein [Leucobacter sp. wl10]RGE20755.1 DAK2 domain-containing protein [Leucobacter sp. wl10]
MRKIINGADAFVDEVLEGILLAHPDELRAATEDRRALVRADSPAAGRVGIVTGGGSGHLPFFLGYVGRGLCSAVAVGNVFSSPSPAQIHAASVAVDGGAGVLYLYGNYGGDVYNFDIAAELCRGQSIEVRTVLGADDVQSAPPASAAMRRGVAGLVLVYKAAGAMADRGASLDEVARVAQRAADATRTMGVGLSPTILPAAGEATFALDEGEMEIGVGIHGERGSHRGPIETADEITDRFLAELGTELDLSAGSRVAVLVNGLGATPLEELYVVYRRVHRVLAERGVEIAYRLVGEYVTSLEMAGASLSIMQLDDELEELLHDPAGSPFFRQGDATVPEAAAGDAPIVPVSAAAVADIVSAGSPSRLRETLIAALPRMERHTDELRELDAILGDGDLGITVSAGSRAAAGAVAGLPEDADARSVLRVAGLAFSSANPSTFAALVGSGLIGAADTLERGAHLGVDGAAGLLRALSERIAERGGAEPGDKTLLDVLAPVVSALEAGAAPEELSGVAAAAVEETAGWRSRRGRAAWQQERSIGQRDPGGVAALRFVEEIVGAAGEE